MTNKEARGLSKAIVKSSHGVSVKFGNTNGRECLHLIVKHPDQGIFYSDTIYEPWQWEEHDENVANRPTRREQRNADLEAAVANKEAQ